MKLFSSKRRVAAAAVVILLALFLVRPGVSRLKTRIANSLSRAVARPVEIGAVHLRFLPQPGFDLDNLVIYEDPTFGAEPMLRSREVVAAVRLTSLIRGRLDISRLELTEPSLNLVRRADGRWNLEELLERTQRNPLAPTAKSKSEARPGFPYIEASSGRINFKAGPEKKPYALLNADFALWQESENSWGARLKAEPLRTDMSLSDVGLLRMNGIWQRAGSLRETPVRFSMEWNGAQLGQLSKLFSGNDKGWRGEVQLEATMSGTPAAMKVMADTSIRDFHRYDIPSSDALRLSAHCDGTYSSAEAMLHDILCSSRVGEGVVALRGDTGLPGVPAVNLSLDLASVPVSAVAQLARRAKKDMPSDLVSTGNVHGNFAMKEDGNATGIQFEGRGEFTDLRLQSANTNSDFSAASIPFTLNSGSPPIGKVKARGTAAEVLPAPDGLHIEYGPFPLALGGPVAAQARGWLARSGYGMVVRGEGELSHTLRLASLLGIPAAKVNVEGTAQMDLQIAGSWSGNMAGNMAGSIADASSGFAPPQVTGTVRLRDVRATIRGTNSPIEISSAELQLLPDEARVEKLSARAAGAIWTGTMALPRGCGTPGACSVRFNLSSEDIALDEIYEWMGARPSRRSWYQVLTSTEPVTPPTFFANLRASGKVNMGHLHIRSVIADRLSASVELDRGKLKLSDVRADVLGGKHRGDWRADFTGVPALYAGSGTLTGISLQQVAEAMHDPWIAGTASGTYQVTASGIDAEMFWQSAEGGLQFDIRDGALPHIALMNSEGPLRVTRWQGRARLRSGGLIEIENGKLLSTVGVFEIHGTTLFGRDLDLKLIRGVVDESPVHAGSMNYSITGTVAEPRVALTPVPQTQAQLKP